MEKKIIQDFYQGKVTIRPETKACLDDYKNGNCVTIALIKAALVQFESIEGIFNSFEETATETHVQYRDGFDVTVNLEEIDIVKNISGIKSIENTEYYKTAIKLYAIIAKRIYLQKENYNDKCITSFMHAVEFLNSGYPTRIAHKLLALGKQKIRIKKIKNHKSVIIRSGAHASYCSYGIQDIMGKTYKIRRAFGISWMKNPLGIGGVVKEAYVLE
ncbi:hypothetical protein [Kordia jejudonensis]|uniref:hypothetical protein n=1 Tax=Kordia jejudonensis TaxID=1348245 RepID=UPI000629862B|nr:hypothetical protein [Kordia jejudonensis]